MKTIGSEIKNGGSLELEKAILRFLAGPHLDWAFCQPEKTGGGGAFWLLHVR